MVKIGNILLLVSVKEEKKKKKCYRKFAINAQKEGMIEGAKVVRAASNYQLKPDRDEYGSNWIHDCTLSTQRRVFLPQ